MALEIDEINVSGPVTASNLTAGATVTGTNTGDQIISDATISLTDITTNDATTSRHGFLRKLSNVSTEFLNGVGNWVSVATSWGSITGTLSSQTDLQLALDAKQSTTGKDASGGYVGLTLFRINFKNAANTFTSFFTNSNTSSHLYTFQDRDGIIADDTDLGLKENVANKSTSTALGASDTLYPTQNAVKTYVDNFLDIDIQGTFSTPASSTTSTTGANLPGAILTAAGTKTKPYQITFTGVFGQSSAANITSSIRFTINGAAQTNYISSIFSTNANWPAMISKTMSVTLAPGDIVRVQFYTSGGTMTMNTGSLTMIGIA